MNEQQFIEKPEGKPVKAFRARVKMYGNDVVVVNPESSKESNRRMIKQKGKSSFYKSEGGEGEFLHYPHQCGCERSGSCGNDAGTVCRTHEGRAEE